MNVLFLMLGEVVKRRCRKCGNIFLTNEKEFMKLLKEKAFEGKNKGVCRTCILNELDNGQTD